LKIKHEKVLWLFYFDKELEFNKNKTVQANKTYRTLHCTMSKMAIFIPYQVIKISQVNEQDLMKHYII
jgi:hypothetical protein